MDPHHYSCIKLFSLFLPLLCLLSWSWPAASTTAPAAAPLFQTPSSTRLAANTLRVRGYSLFASLITSMSTTSNFSGTLLAPPDFAFSSAAAKFLSTRRPPPRPSMSLLFYHTIRPPLVLAWPTLSSREDGDEFHTLYNGNCLYLFRSPYGGEISVSSAPYKNPMVAVTIRQPDLYVDEHLAVHGIDGVLDPSFATKCNYPFPDPMADDAVPRRVNRSFLDRAMRALRRTGYNVVAAAMAIRKSELLSITSVTVIAVSDENLFLKPGGFRYNFRHHVVPIRHRFADLVRISTAGGTNLETLAPNSTVLVQTVDGAVIADGIAVDETEVYRNKWIVVVSVMTSLDDIVLDSQIKPLSPAAVSNDSSPPPAPFHGLPEDVNYPNSAPAYSATSLAPGFNPTNGSSIGRLSPDGETDDSVPIIDGSPAPAPENVKETHCDLSTVVSIGVEGGDLLCLEGAARRLGEMNEEQKKVKIAENVNIADDVFFYI